MSKSILSKVAAVACSVASIVALGVCASAEKLEVNGTNYDLDTSKVNLVATKVEMTLDELKAADYKVQYDVEVANNTGFAPCGVRLVYPSDKNLEIVPTSKGKPGTVGPVGKALMAYLTDNPEEYNVAIGCSSMENTEENGIFFTVEFKLPSTTKGGDKIPMKIEVDRFLDENNHEVAHKVVDGYIMITDVTTPAPVTTTQAPVTTTTAPVTSTAPVTTSVTTAPVVTAAPVTTTKATDTTVIAPATTTTVVTTTADNGTASGKTTTTSKAAGSTAGNKNTTKAGATQTGDTGAGVAVAALLLAAGTAVAAAKKKED